MSEDLFPWSEENPLLRRPNLSPEQKATLPPRVERGVVRVTSDGLSVEVDDDYYTGSIAGPDALRLARAILAEHARPGVDDADKNAVTTADVIPDWPIPIRQASRAELLELYGQKEPRPRNTPTLTDERLQKLASCFSPRMVMTEEECRVLLAAARFVRAYAPLLKSAMGIGHNDAFHDVRPDLAAIVADLGEP